MAIAFDSTVNETWAIGSNSTWGLLTTKTIAYWLYHNGAVVNLTDVLGFGAVSFFRSTDGGTVFRVYGQGWSTSPANHTIPSPSINAWVHIIHTYDATSVSNQPKTYYSGTEQTRSGSTNAAGSYTGAFPAAYNYVGAGTSSSSAGMRVEHYALWNRILTAAEIAQVRVGGPMTVYPGLVLYNPMWKTTTPSLVNRYGFGAPSVTGLADFGPVNRIHTSPMQLYRHYHNKDHASQLLVHPGMSGGMRG